MYLPLTSAIFRGKLSPSSLGGGYGLSERLLRATRELACALGLPDGPAGGVEKVLAELQVPLSLRLSDSFPISYSFSDFNARSTLCRLRGDEMEYALRLSYAGSLPAVLAGFYEALLRAESRWLKQALGERVGQLCSDHDARLLLCRVLDEVYDTGALVDDACRCGYQPGLCGLLKGAMASLYLELTVDFGYLLDEMDYLDYDHLLSDVRYLHPVCRNERLEYNILKVGNEVKRLLTAPVTKFSKLEALKLYGKLSTLHAGFDAPSSVGAGLWRGVSVVESFLFFQFSGIQLCNEGPYILFSDPGWVTDKLEEIYRTHYSDHLAINEGRSASDWIDRKLRERCFSFLRPEVKCRESIPRKLCDYLQHQLDLYEQNFAHSFGPDVPGQQFPTVPVDRYGSHIPDEGEIHKMISFLGTTDDKGEKLMKNEHVKLLEKNFLSFLRNGQTATTCHHQIQILKGYSEVLYGLFFCYQQRRGGDKNEYATFLASMLDVDVQVENLKKNSSRYMRAYLNFKQNRCSRLGC